MNETTTVNTTATSASTSHKYTKVLDSRKRPIRGLWIRNGKYLARLTLESDTGLKSLRWVPLEAKNVKEAKEEIAKLGVQRLTGDLPHIGRSPKFGDYLKDTYIPRLKTSGKKPDTLIVETGHLNRWSDSLGDLYLDKIRPYHVSGHLQVLKEKGKSNRTCNLALVCLRNLLKSARMDGYIKALPVEGIGWRRVEKKAHKLYHKSDIDRLCAAAISDRKDENGNTVPALKSGGEFADYIRFLAMTGAREQEAIKVRWADVDFAGRLVTIGADGDTKNREARMVNFNPNLEAHLKDMHTRRDPRTQWLFPSPQRGEKDERSKTFRESLLIAREMAGMPEFGFHDCRHHFISFAVMNGIDYMTIARWVGHKDGGVLIGKVYGHISNSHAQNMADRMVFAPTVLPQPAALSA